METPKEGGVELEIREYSDADFFPFRCPFYQRNEVRRHTKSKNP
ncbi:MAG: hypothetical protein P8Y97_15285 [Candidatus Lokiarchaeota archaeon]